MKKVLVTIGLVSAFSLSSKSQVMHQDANFVSVGYGVGNIIQSSFQLSEETDADFKYSGVGPLFFKYEYAFAPKIGVGLNVAYAQATADYLYRDQYTTDGSKLLEETLDWKTWSALLRINWHLGENEKVDPYIGIGLGYRTASWEGRNNDPQQEFNSVEIRNPFNFGMDATFGTRFMFTENIGAYAEVGLAKAVLQFGLTAKF